MPVAGDRKLIGPRRADRRRWLLGGAGLAAGLALPALAAEANAAASAAAPVPGCARAPAPDWPAWRAFQDSFLRDGDRVIDPSSLRAQTVSEGQAYAMFFALVAGERARFERLLRWTEDNLAQGDLTRQLPAWLWGHRDDGDWGVIDANSASDADLWLAYVLGEAGRLWRERRYLALSSVLAERILREETARLPGLGRTLLPGPQGFARPGRWQLNPCYAPLFLLRWLATRSADARWDEVLQSSARVLRASAPRGFAPDWAWYAARAGAAADVAADAAADASAPGFELAGLAPSDRIGGYDAVRVYLWLGLTDAHEPLRADLLAHFAPMADAVERTGMPPLAVDTADGSMQGAGPPGFSAALLPFLDALGRDGAARAQAARLAAQPVDADAYFEQALRLFALGWRERRYAFAADGSLQPAWQRCA